MLLAAQLLYANDVSICQTILAGCKRMTDGQTLYGLQTYEKTIIHSVCRSSRQRCRL